MANKKLSELAEKVNLPTNALIHILDPNDLTQSPQGSDFKFDSTKLIPKSAIVDNLLSTSTTSVLSANQGRILNENSSDNLIEAKEYADSLVIGLLDDRGNFDASSNLFPSSGGSGASGAVLKGDLWSISVAGTLGGVAVTAGDVCRSLSNNPEQIASNWNITENNFGYLAENSANKKTTLIGNESSNLFYSSIKAIVDYFTSSRLITILGFTPYNATNPSGFTANSTDDQLRDRSTHTGTQLSSTISDIQSTITNNSNVLANTAKITNATHTGDATGSTALTLATVNANLGTFNNLTVNGKGLVTGASNVDYASGSGSATGTNTGDNATNTQYSGLDSSKENTIASGTTGQYFRGDKTFQELNKAAVGLANAENTSDLNKPISTATQTDLNLKANLISPNFFQSLDLSEGSLKITDVNKLVNDNGNVNIFTTNSQGANLGGSITLGGSFNNLSPLPFASIAGRKLNSANADAAGYLQFNTRQNSGLAERARIDQNGKLLIGVTFSSSNSLLQVNGTVEASPATLSTHLVTKSQLDTKIAGSGTTNQLAKFTGSGAVGNSGITELSNGNVGIGLNDPISQVEVFKELKIRNPINGNNRLNFGWNNDNLTGYIDCFNFLNGNRSDLALQPDGGKVGIGTAAPTERLDVVGNGKFSGILKIGTATGSEKIEIQDGAAASKIRLSNSGGGSLSLGVTSNATSTAEINFTNSLAINGGAATFSSSVTAASFNGSAALTGSPTAPTAATGTNTTQIATTAFVQAIKPYKVYVALLTQTGTSAPVATVLENTLGGTVVWSRIDVGVYRATLVGAFVSGKTTLFVTPTTIGTGAIITSINNAFMSPDNAQISIYNTSGTQIDGSLSSSSLEIRVYN